MVIIKQANSFIIYGENMITLTYVKENKRILLLKFTKSFSINLKKNMIKIMKFFKNNFRYVVY